MVIDREKYMDANEVRQLRMVTEAKVIVDLKKGRVQGVVAWMLIDLALGTGLRVSELAALKVEDVDCRRGALKVLRLKRKHKRTETLAIGTELVQHLKEYLAWRVGRLGDLNTSRRRGLTAAKGALFVGQRGALTSRGLQQTWQASIRRAGLPKELSVHTARHTIAVHLLKKTGNLRQVQKQLGHSSPATTANMYADISFEDMQSGLDGLYEKGGRLMDLRLLWPLSDLFQSDRRRDCSRRLSQTTGYTVSDPLGGKRSSCKKKSLGKLLKPL